MKNIRIFLSENFRFLAVKFSVYLNRRVFVMILPFFLFVSSYCSELHQEISARCRANKSVLSPPLTPSTVEPQQLEPGCLVYHG